MDSERKRQTLCPICEPGWGVPVDEDGCCTTCGAPAFGDGVDTVAAEIATIRAENERLRADINAIRADEVRRWRDRLKCTVDDLGDDPVQATFRIALAGVVDGLNARLRELGDEGGEQ